MNFDSEYILEEEEEEEEEPMPYFQRQRHEERYYEDDTSGFECEIMEFDDEEPLPHAPPKPRKLGLNTVSLTMTSLAEASDKVLSKDELIFCQKKECEAVFSYLDKGEPKQGENGKNVWICKFCGTHNYPELAEGVKLTELTNEESDVLYVEDVEKVPDMKPTDKGDFKVIFVIDTSASMCQTTPVKTSEADEVLKEIVKRETEASQQFMMGMHGGDNQMIQQVMQMMQQGFQGPGNQMGGLIPLPQAQRQNPDQLDVTRLQAIKAAVIRQIRDLKRTDPRKRVALVAFSEKVTVYGDGIKDNISNIEGGQLMDRTEIQMVGQRYRELRPIEESADDLIDIIKNLKEEGRTALGPALVVAQEMASSSRGSKVILCTDGFANIGLGKLEESNDQDIKAFYDAVINVGKISAVSVSLICFDDAGIKTQLGAVPEETGGILEKIKATECMEHLSYELTRQTVATHGEIKFVVNKDMYVKDEKVKESMHSKYSYLIGNIRQEKRIPFTFAFRQQQGKNDQASKDISCCSSHPSGSQTQGTATSSAPATDATAANNTSAASTSQTSADAGASSTSQTPPAEDEKTTCPFQVQIFYTDMKGVRAWRVWTREKPLTKNREVAEKTLNTDTGVSNFLQTSSEKLLNETNDSKRRDLVPSINSQIDNWIDKLKSDDNVQRKRLTQYKDLVTEVGAKGLSEDLAAKLRKVKEDRATLGQG